MIFSVLTIWSLKALQLPTLVGQSLIPCPVLSAMFACFVSPFSLVAFIFHNPHILDVIIVVPNTSFSSLKPAFVHWFVAKTDLCCWWTRKGPASLVDFHLFFQGKFCVYWPSLYLKIQLLCIFAGGSAMFSACDNLQQKTTSKHYVG